MKTINFSMLRLLVIYSGFFLLTTTCGIEPGKKHADFVASMLKIRDSLHGLDTNNKVAYWIEANGRVVCDIKLRDQNISNNLFELQQCEDCFSFYTGKRNIISLTDSIRNYEDLANRLRLDILNKTPKNIIWHRMRIVYDNPQDTFFYHYFSDGKVWGLCWGDGKKVL